MVNWFKPWQRPSDISFSEQLAREAEVLRHRIAVANPWWRQVLKWLKSKWETIIKEV